MTDTTDWIADEEGWSRKIDGLDLRVWRVGTGPDEPWGYEVILVKDDVTEHEVATGGAADLKAARAAADAAAVAWGNGEGGATDDDDD